VSKIKAKIVGRNSAERYKNKLFSFYVTIENRQIYVEIYFLLLFLSKTMVVSRIK